MTFSFLDQTIGEDMNLLFLTDDPEVAGYTDVCGVRTVFIDLESLGKQERQGGMNTVISQHQRENISPVKAALSNARLLVRTNPLHSESSSEVDYCIDAGADMLMLPMFRSAAELEEYCDLVDGRVPVVPLVETVGALRDVEQIVTLAGVSELHFGLNDLRIDIGLSFLFEVVAQGVLDEAAEICRTAGVPFGVGGISRVEGGLIPGRSVLGEYLRLGASGTILSRCFHQSAENLDDLKSKVDLKLEIEKLNTAREELLGRPHSAVESDHVEFQQRIGEIVSSRKAA